MSGPALATSYEESVASCGPPTPHTSPAPSVPRGTPVRRQLDFTGGGDLEDDDEEFLCRVADDIERGYGKAKRRAPECVCARGVCAVERDDKSGQWKYVCPSRPKCNHVSFYEEVDLILKSQPTTRSHPKPFNPCVFNDPSNHMARPRTPVNINIQVTGATTLANACPQIAGAKALVSCSPQGAGVITLVNVSRHGVGAVSPANDSPQGAGVATPAKFIPRGPITTTPARVSPQGDRSNCEVPVCQCTAGKCKKIRVGNEDWYVCPIPKGKGACSYRVLVSDMVHLESPSMLHSPIAAVNTPSKSPMRPYSTPSPISPTSNNECFRCYKTGHWTKDCPKQPH